MRDNTKSSTVFFTALIAVISICLCCGAMANTGNEELSKPIVPPTVNMDGLNTYPHTLTAEIEAVEDAETVEAVEPEQVAVREEKVVETVATVEAVQPVEAVQVSGHDDEIYIMAQAMAGESFAHDYNDQLKVGMTICNRVDDSRFPNTIHGVITQPYQVQGYHPSNVPSETYIRAATQVINAWYGMKNGIPCDWWNGSYLWWCSVGSCNEFRSVY